ncbi:MAG: hypothetical protein M1820_003574 [Bogoriella megaspora]|nr:MAG: hypothetical protein M1820_003574 [Bogoriella megaspora]
MTTVDEDVSDSVTVTVDVEAEETLEAALAVLTDTVEVYAGGLNGTGTRLVPLVDKVMLVEAAAAVLELVVNDTKTVSVTVAVSSPTEVDVTGTVTVTVIIGIKDALVFTAALAVLSGTLEVIVDNVEPFTGTVKLEPAVVTGKAVLAGTNVEEVVSDTKTVSVIVMILVDSTVTVDSPVEVALEEMPVDIRVELKGSVKDVVVAAAAEADELMEADVSEAAELIADTTDELAAEASDTGQTVVVA